MFHISSCVIVGEICPHKMALIKFTDVRLLTVADKPLHLCCIEVCRQVPVIRLLGIGRYHNIA